MTIATADKEAVPEAARRPRILRGVQVDEKTATLFVERAMDYLAQQEKHDLDKVCRIVSRDGASLWNPVGRSRFERRLAKAAGPSILKASFIGADKRVADFLIVQVVVRGDLLVVQGDLFKFRRNGEDDVGTRDIATVRRHALVRAVQRAGVREVDDVFGFLQSALLPLSYMVMAAEAASATTPVGHHWLVPVPVGLEEAVGLLVERPTVGEPAVVVTIYRGEWRPVEMATAVEGLMMLADDPAVADAKFFDRFLV